MTENKFFITHGPAKREKITLDELGDAIQQAIEIEITTIPAYLYTYYSINRSPDQLVVKGRIYEALVSGGMANDQARETALDLSADIMVYANKAGALIMSVAIEEMLHMSLSSNLKQALRGMPILTGRSPESWPYELPGHEPKLVIDLAPFTLNQIKAFLAIESPHPLPVLLGGPVTIHYNTIGEFYNMIRTCLIENDSKLTYDKAKAQLVSKYYYADNNIDTVYYDKKHDPHFVNATNSGGLMKVEDLYSALKAISTIVDQGEGMQEVQGLNPDGTPDCSSVLQAGDFDDAGKEELSHFEKFKEIYCHYNRLTEKFNKQSSATFDISQFFVLNIPVNPKAADYPDAIRPVADLINGVYTYIFVMIEECYRKSGNTQFEIFMFGIHKTMIFILNSLCGTINSLTYTRDGQTYTATATFENYPFSKESSPKAQLIALYNTAVNVFPAISYLGYRILDLPDVPLA